jgi:homoserine O-succinyltransferase
MAGVLPTRPWSDFSRRRHDGPIVIGLVNNMPDAALKSTERQFRELLTDAGGRRPLRLRVFSLSSLPRSAAGQHYVRENYEDISELWDAELDGLIVTGTEPKATDLTDEPYWPALTELIDWAATHVTASLWSCLGAHAAVRHLDGVERRPRASKLSGVYECVKTADHPLLGNGPARWWTPHSRHNELPVTDLVQHGYQLLSHSDQAGADIFVKHVRGSTRTRGLFVFLQGHPEYDAGALMREYRRDIGRFLSGERDDYPDMPHPYFDAATTETMLEFRERALRERNSELLPSFQMLLAQQSLTDPWRRAALRFFGNFLAYLSREQTSRPGWSDARRSSPRRARSEVSYA